MIGLLDSGIGGFAILKSLQNHFPSLNYHYLADQLNFPYSEKSVKKLNQILEKNVEFLINQKCKIIIVACNTATVLGIKNLRQKFPHIIFIGTVPAIKPAAVKNKKILILSTHNTANSDYLKSLVNKFAPDSQITNIGSTQLVEYIENWHEAKIQTELTKILPLQKFDAIVLGCTHFLFIKNLIATTLGYQPNFFSPEKGIVKRLKTLLSSTKLKKIKGKIFFYSTLPHQTKHLSIKYQTLTTNF